MDDMAIAYINAQILVWARKKAQMTQAELSRNIATVDKVAAWETGERFPTLSQAEGLANKLRIPLPVLFLTAPPLEQLPVADLRTLRSAAQRKPSANFLEVINDALVRQDWYREEFPNAVPRILAKQFAISDSVTVVADYLRRTLWINDDLRNSCSNWNDFLLKIVQNAERAGVLVMRSSIVRHDNRRKLNVDEFRGFALADPVAPLVFVNSVDPTTAQIFTVVHELCHLCINESGISNPDPTKAPTALKEKIELFCNQVAAEVLVPSDKFKRAWQSSFTDAENIKRIVKFFKVSNLVALRRAFDLNKITSTFFFKAVKADYARFKKRMEKEKEKERRGGPDFWTMFALRNGVKFTDSLLTALQGGKVAYTEAANLLGVRIPTLEIFASGRVA